MNHITTVIDPIAILIVVTIAIETDVLLLHVITNPNEPVTGIIIGIWMIMSHTILLKFISGVTITEEMIDIKVTEATKVTVVIDNPA